MRIALTLIVAAVWLFSAVTVVSDDVAAPQPLAAGARKTLLAAVGDPDPVVPHRMASALTMQQLTSAFYSDDRAARLIALDAAGSVEEPWSLLSYLAALMGARDRQVAARAAQSFVQRLRESLERVELAEVVSGQVQQIFGQLNALSRDVRLDVDIRTSALESMRMLGDKGYARAIAMISLLEDDDIAVRRHALAILAPPLEEKVLVRLAQMATDDEDLRLRGQAAALLCENAVAHNVKAPSNDLRQILGTVLGDGEIPGDGIGPILSCLASFPSEARVDLLDIARGHPSPAVAQFLKSMGRR